MLRHVQTLTHGQGKVWSLSWSPSGSMLATCGEDKEVRVWWCDNFSSWTAGSGEPPFSLATKLEGVHERTIRDVSWSPCGRFLATASFDATANLWEKISNGGKTDFKHVASVEGHENEVKSISWAHSGDFFATCGRDKTVMIWSFSAEADYEVECECVLVSHSQDVKRVLWHPTQDKLASSSYDNTLKIFAPDSDGSDWSCTDTLEGHSSTVWGLDFDETGSRIASSSADKTVRIWEKSGSGWSCSTTIGGYHGREVYDLSWNRKSKDLVTACGDNHLRVFRETGGEGGKGLWEMIGSVTAHEGDVNRVEWNPQVQGLLASAGDDGKVKLWTHDP